MNDDLRRAKAIQEGQDRARGYRPTIAITKSLRFALVLRPYAVVSPVAQAGFGRWVKVNLPGWRFDAKHDRWFAPIAQLPEAVEAMKRRPSGVNVSAGAEGWLNAKEVPRPMSSV
jgi:hypothetical protein